MESILVLAAANPMAALVVCGIAAVACIYTGVKFIGHIAKRVQDSPKFQQVRDNISGRFNQNKQPAS